MNNLSVIGIDLAKQVFQLHGLDQEGRSILKKKLSRHQMLRFFAQIPPCLIGMEACGGSHYWARELSKLGHQVKLMAPQYVKPYVKTNKNDAADAEAISEAVTRPNMRFVEIKNAEQQVLLLMHRERDGLIKERTALVNRIRATLAEFGITIPAGINRLKVWFRQEYGEHEQGLPALLSQHIQNMLIRLTQKDQDILVLDKEIDREIQQNERCKRLLEVLGIGRLTSSALVASIGNASTFSSGRQLAAWLGIVPKQHSSGGKQILQGISKRGDVYIRRLLIHGARAVIRHLKSDHPWFTWISGLEQRMHRNKVVVAIANKLARIAWALLVKGVHYERVGA